MAGKGRPKGSKNGHISEKKRWEEYDQKTAKLTDEEKKMRIENLSRRGGYSLDAVKSLCSQVCLTAIHDYKKYRKKLGEYMEWIDLDEMRVKMNGMKVSEKIEKKILYLQEDIEECEEFFQSDMFTACSGFEGGLDEILRKIYRIPKEYEYLIAKGRA